eukprot:2327145-Rhodomonas_salina.1
MYAIDNELQELAEKLIEKGADVQAKDLNVCPPFACPLLCLPLASLLVKRCYPCLIPFCTLMAAQGCSRLRKREELHGPRR